MIAPTRERNLLIVQQCEKTKLTYAEVGKLHGISRERVRQILIKSARNFKEPEPHWTDGLSSQPAKVLIREGFNSAEGVRKALPNLTPYSFRGLSIAGLLAIHKWLLRK